MLVLLLIAVAANIAWSDRTADRPPEPGHLSYQALSATSVRLSWTGPADVDKYVVRIGANRSLTSQVESISSKNRSMVLSGLTATSPGTDGFFRVVAHRDGQVASSRTGAFSLAPTPITKISVAKLATNGVKLRWPATTNTRQYDVVLARDKAFSKDVMAVRTGDGEPSYTTTSLHPGKKYFVKARPVNGSTLGAFSAPLAFTTPAEAKTFVVGSWNVCSEKCKGYPARARLGAKIFNAEGIDIFGLQESGGVRVGRTTKAIFSGGSQGFVRADGGAKARYIFYRPALFRQLAGGQFPLGDDRDATWAHMQVKDSGQKFFYVDVHLENGHGNDAKRRREMGVLLDQMARINADKLPIIYAGDFNSGKHRPKDSPGVMMRAAGMVDAFDISSTAPVNAQYNSGHSFSTHVPASGALIDHIFVSPEFKVSSWEQLVRIGNGRYLKPMVSDHNALKATLILKSTDTTDLGDPTPATQVPAGRLTLR